MEAVALLRNRIAAVGANTRGMFAAATGLDWVTPLLPGTSPLGLTFWHLPRTVDWLINTSVRGQAEVVDDPAFADLPDPDEFGFGTGLSPERAADAASRVRAPMLAAYSEAVHAMADDWLAALSPEQLYDVVPDFMDRQRARPAYCTDDALAEVTGVAGLPLGILLSRPAMAHLMMHTGEIGLILQLVARPDT